MKHQTVVSLQIKVHKPNNPFMNFGCSIIYVDVKLNQTFQIGDGN